MKKAQVLVNYMVLVVVGTLALVGIAKYVQRGIQGRVADLSDVMLTQKENIGQGDHLAYIDVNLIEQITDTTQDAKMTTIVKEGGAQDLNSDMDAQVQSHSVTYDPDKIARSQAQSAGTTGSTGGILPATQ